MDNLLQNSPTLQQVKYYFDLLHRTMEGYPFITDLKTGITMIAPELVKEYDLPGTITKDFGSMWEALIYHEDVMRYQSSMAAIIGRTKVGCCVTALSARTRPANPICSSGSSPKWTGRFAPTR